MPRRFGGLWNWGFAVAAIWVAAATDLVWAQDAAAGRFLATVGDVRVVGRDGVQRAAQRGAEVREGETLLTGANGFAQVRLADGGLLALRANTEMTLTKFAYTGEGDRNASLFIELLKGGFRSITGLIGRVNRDGYRVTTASATIGIRGTDHEVVHVTAPVATPQVAAGTYDRVYEGQTVISNAQGVSQVVSRGQVGFVALAGVAPPVLVPPPPALFVRSSPTLKPAAQAPPESAPGSPAAASPTPTSPAQPPAREPSATQQAAPPPDQAGPRPGAPTGEKAPAAGPKGKPPTAAPPGPPTKP